MSNEFDKPMDIDPQGCVPQSDSIVGDINKIPLEWKGPDVNLTLQQRGANYGDYGNMAYVAQKIKNALRHGDAWGETTSDQRESLDLIATKIARIVCGNPSLPDSWLDIEGYAKLARDRIPQYPAIP